MGRIITIGVFTIIGLGGGFLGGRWYANSTLAELESVNEEPAVKSVLAEGKIKPAEGIRFVTTMPGRKIQRLNVAVGSDVKAGQTELCIMADEPILKMQWMLATAKKKDLGNEVDQQILAAELNKTTAEAALKEAKLNQMRLSSKSPESSYVDKKIESSAKKLVRLKQLAQEESTSAFVSTQDIFDQEIELEKARAEKTSLQKAANLAVESAEEALDIAKRALVNANAAKKESESLNLAESIARQQYFDARIFAPIDGEVIKIHAKEGDNVANLPIMEVADLSSMVVEAEVYFANLSDVKLGQKVTISSPALDEDLIGKVVSKSNYIGNSFLQSANPLAMSNQETAKVTIAIEPEYTKTARSFLNLQVTAEISTE